MRIPRSGVMAVLLVAGAAVLHAQDVGFASA